jgi:hypothetical protein
LRDDAQRAAVRRQARRVNRRSTIAAAIGTLLYLLVT